MDDQYPLELFSPDETLITDPGYAVSHSRQCESEKKLLVAVLKDAISDFKKYRYSGQPRFREAESWIFGPDTDRLFAFKTVCAMLNLSAERVRKDLRNFDDGSVSTADYPPAYRACKPERGVRTCRFIRESANARKSNNLGIEVVAPFRGAFSSALSRYGWGEHPVDSAEDLTWRRNYVVLKSAT